MKKIYENDLIVVWRGLDLEILNEIIKDIDSGNKLHLIYATAKEFIDINFEFPSSNFLALYEMLETVSDEFLIGRYTQLENLNWTPIAGITVGKL